jgi:DNA-binding transcriptional ArsR family regulator
VATAPPVPHPLPDALVEIVTQRFRILGEPMRIKILDRLRASPATVGELRDATGATQQNVSKHLGVLLAARMVSRAREGNFVRYAIADDTLFALCEVVSDGLRRQLDELDAVFGDGGDDR